MEKERQVPMSKNKKKQKQSEADALASKAAGMPQAVIKGDQMITWNSKYLPVEQEIEKLPPVNCRREIESLIKMGERAKFQDFTKLKTGGLDGYSRARVEPRVVLRPTMTRRLCGGWREDYHRIWRLRRFRWLVL